MLIFGLCMHEISTASVACFSQLHLQPLDKCFIQSLCIFCEITKQMSPLKVITLFCREVEYCRIYAFFVLILLAHKCTGANCHAFCMSEYAQSAQCAQCADANNQLLFPSHLLSGPIAGSSVERPLPPV